MNRGLLVVAVFVILIAAAYITSGFGVTGNIVSKDTSRVSGETFKIPLSKISETAQWYSYDAGGTNVKYFVVKANDGTIKTGFDACDVCYGSKKGYRQEGEYMVCNNCGNRYPIAGLGTENKNPGGCWPGYLPSTINGDNLIIKQSDLEDGKWRY